MRRAASAPIQTTFVIPNLNKEEKRIPISAVVLSSQRVDLKDAIYDAAKAKDRAKEECRGSAGSGWKEVDSQRDARVLRPATRFTCPSRRISSRRCQVRRRRQDAEAAPSAQPLFAFVTLYQGGKKLYETPPKSIVPSADQPIGDDAAELRSRRRQFAARIVRLPGDGARSVDAEGGFLARADQAGAVRQ